jgi:hypothetical protein
MSQTQKIYNELEAFQYETLKKASKNYLIELLLCAKKNNPIELYKIIITYENIKRGN